jgi:FHS family L-fucose permease-like MFS transporter
MFAIFFYVGAEVSIGSNLIAFLGLPSIGGFTEVEASKYVAYYWGGAMIGRFLGSISLSEMKTAKKYSIMFAVGLALFVVIFFITKADITNVWYYLLFMAANYIVFILGKSLPARTLTIFSMSSIILLLIGLFTTGKVAMWAILGIGLFNSIMWSNIFTLAIDGLGKYTSQGSSLLVMMIVGGAILPLMQGLFADMIGVQYSLFVPLFGYSYLIFYGLYGYKKRVKA